MALCKQLGAEWWMTIQTIDVAPEIIAEAKRDGVRILVGRRFHTVGTANVGYLGFSTCSAEFLESIQAGKKVPDEGSLTRDRGLQVGYGRARKSLFGHAAPADEKDVRCLVEEERHDHQQPDEKSNPNPGLPTARKLLTSSPPSTYKLPTVEKLLASSPPFTYEPSTKKKLTPSQRPKSIFYPQHQRRASTRLPSTPFTVTLPAGQTRCTVNFLTTRCTSSNPEQLYNSSWRSTTKEMLY
ncbi:hypothetical protein EG327_007354 [Venturia inaequalis]|uniref:Uncharacterized protein n=1 Tax=Venturia inaequalis TaxID=5025 RepID=A0A8H3ZGV3_VENIN|nr:hypothetical protein EG327_007354 [Venturia inaequalis]